MVYYIIQPLLLSLLIVMPILSYVYEVLH